MEISEINRLLARQHGTRTWQPHHDPVSELIAVILSQNTSDTNSNRAFNALVGAFGNWEQVAAADVEAIEHAIKSGGLSHIKAARIKQILQTIQAEWGNPELSFLDTPTVEDAKARLMALPGVGPKTASCVLLFSLGKPVFPVDTHVYRVCHRLGLIANGASIERAHRIMAERVPPAAVYQLHMNMVHHGRTICRSRHPKCSVCSLKEECPSRTVRG